MSVCSHPASELIIVKKMSLVYGKENIKKKQFKTKRHNDIFLLASTYMMSQHYISIVQCPVIRNSASNNSNHVTFMCNMLYKWIFINDYQTFISMDV